MADEAGQKLGKHSAAELLGNWRAAERDLVAARANANTASLAEKAAHEAERAAKETSDAARLSQVAAERAAEAAHRTTEAARMTAMGAAGDRSDADAALEKAERAEAEAGDRFRDAQRHGFPQDEAGSAPAEA
jgi:hypothetical protein